MEASVLDAFALLLRRQALSDFQKFSPDKLSTRLLYFWRKTSSRVSGDGIFDELFEAYIGGADAQLRL